MAKEVEKAKAASPTGKGRIDIEGKLKLLREAGIEIVGENSSSYFGGITIIGAPMPSDEEEDKPKP